MNVNREVHATFKTIYMVMIKVKASLCRQLTLGAPLVQQKQIVRLICKNLGILLQKIVCNLTIEDVSAKFRVNLVFLPDSNDFAR